ncbi:MAG TPA: hypothetical protein VE732_04240 [Nitrososphaera sp.]|jgi:hypothetical protein|nr:hypothetical protein [Nitrososphaera sp.]
MTQTELRCNAKTKTGEQCHNNALPGSKYCRIKSHHGINISPFKRLEGFIQSHWLVTIIALTATLLGMSVGLLQLKYYYEDKEREKRSVLDSEQHPISVSPSEINLNSFDENNQLKVKNYLNIYNRTDNWYYQIWFKILIDSPVITTEQIALNLSPSESIEQMKSEPSGMSTKALCYKGLDGDRHEAFLCFIRDLNPKETFTLTLMSDAPKKLLESQTHKALVSVVGFGTKPTQILEGNKKGSMNLVFPETFTVRGISVISNESLNITLDK